MLAQRINDLVVFSNDGDKFTLILNGERRNMNPETRVKVSGLDLTTYKAKIIFENNKFEDVATDITFYNNGYECVFGLVETNKRKHRLDYVSSTLINPPLSNNSNSSFNSTNNTNTYNTNTNGTNTNSTYNNSTNSNSTYTNNTNSNSTNSNKTYGNNTYSSSNNTSYNSGNTISVNNNGVGVGLNSNGGVTLKTREGNINLGPHNETTAVINVLGNAINLHKAPEKIGCKSPMLETQFEIARKDLTVDSTDSGRLKAANQIIQNNCMLTSQVKEIMGVFSSDQTKLEFAMSAYNHTSDLHNYHLLKDSFKSEAYQKDFHTFVNSK
jgi:hypothetical protein